MDQKCLPEMMVFMVFDGFWKWFIGKVKEMEVKNLRRFLMEANVT